MTRRFMLEVTMLIYVTDPLFAWARLEDHPQLSTLKQLHEALPDEALLAGLRLARGRGRDDYTVEQLWGVVVLTVALRHTSFEACLAELHRNPSLCRLIGIPSVHKPIFRRRGQAISFYHIKHPKSILNQLLRTCYIRIAEGGAWVRFPPLARRSQTYRVRQPCQS
jgi:hypothetical protein